MRGLKCNGILSRPDHYAESKKAFDQLVMRLLPTFLQEVFTLINHVIL